jgi:transposase
VNPAENTSATFRGRIRVSHRGRPALRASAWRAVWGALPHDPVLGAKFTHLATGEHDRLAPGQARVACAAALLRRLHAIITKRQPWTPDIASATTADHQERGTAAA